MKKIFAFFFLGCAFCLVQCAFSQAPQVKIWDARFGGTSSDYLTSFNESSDGGFILVGYSWSGIGGDKTAINWDTAGLAADIWLVKINSAGSIEWDKTIGGTSGDRPCGVLQTSDGGYLIGASSPSQVGGNKTQPPIGDWDFWLIKTDPLGNILWDKVYGGLSGEEMSSLRQTADGGFILAGVSASGIGGDKTQPSQGGLDYWILKIDSIGNKLWDKTFGGTAEDFLREIIVTEDRGFILGGLSLSGVGGDKTQPNWDVSGTTYDYWIVKTDSLGNKIWDKNLGGTDNDIFMSMEKTGNDGCLTGGFSFSGLSGDKSQPNWGASDFWLVMLDSAGNKVWDKNLGGVNFEDDFGRVFRTADGGFLASGTSYSNISGNKTENNLGLEQIWAVKIDSLGNTQWDKTAFTVGHDEVGWAIQTHEGCYAFANHSRAAIGGHKSQDIQGGDDYWIVKFCDSTLLPMAGVSGNQFLCPGTCASFINLSMNATTYQWIFPGASPDTSSDANPLNICYFNSGTYDVTLIASSAIGSDTLTLANYIIVYPSPSPQSISQNGDTLFAIAGATSYQWYFNGNLINGATDYYYVAITSGDYNVVATDGNGCEVEAAIFNVIASVQEIEEQELLIFPNPVEDKFTIHPESFGTQFTMGTAAEISVYNLIGEIVLAVSPLSFGEGQGGEADVHSLSPGLYFLEIISLGKTFRMKFVKE